jgi:hypothetical protein
VGWPAKDENVGAVNSHLSHPAEYCCMRQFTFHVTLKPEITLGKALSAIEQALGRSVPLTGRLVKYRIATLRATRGVAEKLKKLSFVLAVERDEIKQASSAKSNHSVG